MKLPATESSSSDSGTQFEEAYRGHPAEANGRQSGSDGQNHEIDVVGNFRIEHQPGFPTPGGFAPGEQPDFSEFLWMEHEDEYDQEVMRELEEEEMINYYFDLYQDSLQAEANGQEYPLAHMLGSAGLTTNQGTGSTATVGAGDELSARFNNALNFQSTLNPNAAEFVPRFLSGESQEKL